MSIKNIYIVAVLALATFSCQNQDSDTDVNPEDIYSKTNIFPQQIGRAHV